MNLRSNFKMKRIVEIYNQGERYIGELLSISSRARLSGLFSRRLIIRLLKPDIKIILIYNRFVKGWIFPNGELIDRIKIHRATIEEFAHNSGFVLPVFEMGGEFYCLLGRETKGSDRGRWDSWGGKRDPGETPLETASREFWEESLLEYSTSLAKTQIYVQNNSIPICIYDGRSLGHMLYITFFKPWQIFLLIEKFRNTANTKTRGRSREQSSTGVGKIEKDDLAIVSFDNLMKTIRKEESVVEAQVYDLNGRITTQKIQLRPIFRKIMTPYLNFHKSIKEGDVEFYSI
ncbi:MAG: hypothetical protein Solivirus1_28 [Solivirus sp.]|uniref:Nudix hydrolase domain-containing protein n=1 Tax=Solivirus sp. TaxID=2487772 RepID=A0A3G5AHU5_9VIRU|nr:MAG: hypothetical protein Solivirus1_28 [Solivirus sp.]